MCVSLNILFDLKKSFIKNHQHIFFFLLTGSPRLPDGYVVKRSYAVCEGEVLNMSMTVVSVPGPVIIWSFQPKVNQQVLLQNPSGNNVSVIYTSRYVIPIVERQTFGNYEFEARNAIGGPIRFTFQVVRGPSCKGKSTNVHISTVFKTFFVFFSKRRQSVSNAVHFERTMFSKE